MNDKIFDKNIHKDEFRLRLLVTDGCNKNCTFCLNDFMDKPTGTPELLDTYNAISCIKAYSYFMRTLKKEIPIITFSGGEPGIHPDLGIILDAAKTLKCVTKVVTNGTALYIPNVYKVVDCWHISVTGIDYDLVEYLNRNRNELENVQIQFVVTDYNMYYTLYVVEFYVSRGFKIKLFVDFNSLPLYRSNIENRIKNAYKEYPNSVITRFTGVQENRGLACEECNKQCVTLKALWVFPDGGASTCPQGVVDKEYPSIYYEWVEIIEAAYELHKRI